VTRPISQVDVALPVLREQMTRLVARQKVDAAVERLRLLLADPQAATHGKAATAGDTAEMRHLLYDADADATEPAFPYPTCTPKEASK
jgi:hypothetical protein